MAWYDKKTSKGGIRFWFRSKNDEELYRSVCRTIEMLQQTQGHHHARNREHSRLYHNREIIDGVAGSGIFEGYENRITYNLVESAIDTIHADITGSKPVPMFLTDNGNFRQQRQAKMLNRYAAGQFYDAKIHETESQMAAYDALIYGTGVLKTYPNKDRPAAERVFIDNILIDDNESRNGRPRNMFELRRADRSVLAALYPKASKKLKDTPGADVESDGGGSEDIGVADEVLVREAWHLPSSEDSGDGRHVIVVANAVLLDEPWTKEYFPFSKLTFKPRSQGWQGKGVAEILTGRQYAINELLWKIHESLRLSGPKIFVEPGSQLNTAHLDNEVWGIIECIGVPKHVVFDSVPPDLFRQLRQEIEDGFSEVGVNMLAARSEIPAGLDGGSGKAIRMYADQKSKRLIKFAQSYESLHLELSKQFIETTRAIAESGVEPKSVLAPDGGKAYRVKWKDVDLDRDSYIMQVFPTSFLSSTPAGKIADLETLTKAFPQLQEHALKLLDFPDLQSVVSLATSSADLVHEMLDGILYDKKSFTPEPAMDLSSTLKFAQSYYLRAKIDGAPEEALRRILVFIKTCGRLIKDAESPPPQPAMPQLQAGQPPAVVPPPQGAM